MYVFSARNVGIVLPGLLTQHGAFRSAELVFPCCLTAFSADIRYIYRKTDGAITAIDNLADAKIYLPEVPGATAQISDPNIYQEERGFRISVTGTLSFTLENADVTQGGEFSSVETSGNQSNVITTAKTFAILFQQSDIQK